MDELSSAWSQRACLLATLAKTLQRLRTSRDYLGFSQDEVAKHLGISRTALSNIESGQRKVDALELKKLAALYQRSIAYFTDRTE